MSNILIINGHQPYPFTDGKLNASLVERAHVKLGSLGHSIRVTEMVKGYEIEAEVANHIWADTVILQYPINWMGTPWSLKKYIDEVYSVGAGGGFCNGDGRTSQAPKDNYGGGGALSDKSYMLSVTFNAPAEAFDDPGQYLFGGRSVDDLLFPQHMNFRFFGMQTMPTFSVHDVMKNPQIETDFARFDTLLERQFP